ncbi:MAG: methyltransferase [Actinobacteria bacterium]|nr:methyltransferase [Actinomycetota bacterium]
MIARERIRKAIDHEQPDKLPVDFGGMLGTGINASVVYKLRQYFGLDRPETPVKIIEPFQMLGEIKDDLREIIGIDTVPLLGSKNFFGFENDNWKEWQLWDGTPVLVAGKFNTKVQDDGSIFMYAQGDTNFPPAAKMPFKGYYFDLILRQEKIDDSNLKIEDNVEEFSIFPDDELNYIKKQALDLYKNTGYSIFASLVQSGFGDPALVPGPTLKNPKGLRDLAEWYMSLITRKEFVRKIFERQCEIAFENYKRIHEQVGELIDVVFITGTDFGSQNSLFISKELYRDLFKPFHIKINEWIHNNTAWKTFIHSCGSVEPLMKDFIEAGFDVFNPVQISAYDMDPAILKKKYGKDITFWGGGVDTQKVLPFGTPDEVRKHTKKMIDIFFNDSSGYIFNTVHNIQANTPIENVVSMINVIGEYR